MEGAATNTLHMFHIGVQHLGGIGGGVRDFFLAPTDTKKWTLLNASGEIPEARGDHSCASSGTKLFVFGGSLGENSFLNSLYCLETGMERRRGTHPYEGLYSHVDLEQTFATRKSTSTRI